MKHQIKDTWKKKEPQGRLSKKAISDQTNFQRQRAEMEEKSTQKILIICHKSLMLPPGQFRSFHVELKIPMRKDEIDKRMKAAFPEFEWGEP